MRRLSTAALAARGLRLLALLLGVALRARFELPAHLPVAAAAEQRSRVEARGQAAASAAARSREPSEPGDPPEQSAASERAHQLAHLPEARDQLVHLARGTPAAPRDPGSAAL